MIGSAITRAARLALALAAASAGCVSEDSAGSGTVTFSLAGGEALREGFPHVEGGTISYAFTDGWALQFERYVLTVGEITLSDPASGQVRAQWSGGAVVDLMRHASAQRLVATLSDVPARRLDVAFTAPAARPDFEVVDADAEDVAEMQTNGWSFLMEGTATRGAEAVVFRVGLPAVATYRRCANGNDGTFGVAVAPNTTTPSLLSSHVVHLFWDALLGEADLRFDAWAAVAGDDGVVTEAELQTQSLFDLRGAEGDRLLDETGAPVLYDDAGLLPPGETSLADFVRYGAMIGFHFNGLGFCDYQPGP